MKCHVPLVCDPTHFWAQLISVLKLLAELPGFQGGLRRESQTDSSPTFKLLGLKRTWHVDGFLNALLITDPYSPRRAKLAELLCFKTLPCFVGFANVVSLKCHLSFSIYYIEQLNIYAILKPFKTYERLFQLLACTNFFFLAFFFQVVNGFFTLSTWLPKSHKSKAYQIRFCITII